MALVKPVKFPLIPQVEQAQLVTALSEMRSFTLSYDSGAKQVPGGDLSASVFNLFLLVRLTVRAHGDIGKSSFAYHCYRGDFFGPMEDFLNSIPELSRGRWGPGWSLLKNLRQEAEDA